MKLIGYKTSRSTAIISHDEYNLLGADDKMLYEPIYREVKIHDSTDKLGELAQKFYKAFIEDDL